MTFRSSILAGVSLIRAAIRSPNYVHNVSGWTINQDGSAEFNNIQIRGSSTVGGTALYYAGTPAAGNLRYSISDTAGTDAYGNNYGQGVIAYHTGFTGDVGMVGGQFTLGHAPGFSNSATVRQSLTFGGDILLDSGQGDSDHLDNAILRVLAGHASQVSGSATAPAVIVLDNAATSAVDLHLSGSVIATDLSGNPRTWQTPSYNSGWAADSASAGTYQPLQFRLDAQNNVILDGIMHTTSSTPNAVAFTLPAGYRPTGKGRRFITMSNTGGLVPVYISIATNGDVSVTSNPGASNVDVMFENFFPLGIIP